MKYQQVIAVDDHLLEWDSESTACSNGLYTVRHKTANKRDWRYSCEFSHALEMLARELIEESENLDDKKFKIKLKMNDLLWKLPSDWKQKWNPDYELKTWN